MFKIFNKHLIFVSFISYAVLSDSIIKNKQMKFVSKLTPIEKRQLDDLMRNSTSYRVRKRAHVILLSSRKYKIDELSDIFMVDRDTVSDWIDRWEKDKIEGLHDASRSGRPKKNRKKTKARK